MFSLLTPAFARFVCCVVFMVDFIDYWLGCAGFVVSVLVCLVLVCVTVIGLCLCFASSGVWLLFVYLFCFVVLGYGCA